MLTMRSREARVVVLLAGLVGLGGMGCSNGSLGGATSGTQGTGTQIPGSACSVFLPDSPWNEDISGVTVDPTGSSAYMANMNASQNLHPDFGSIYGIPYQYVDNSVTKSSVSFDYADESDKGPYPIPSNPVIEDGGDAHLLVVQTDECKLYELYDFGGSDGSFTAGSGAIWDLKVDATRPACWTSADAAGLPIYPGLARYEEAKQGEITHALRFTMSSVQAAYTAPASHYGGDDSSTGDPPFGLHLRLKASTDLSKATPQAKIVLTALQKYGMFVADNGSNWYVSGEPNAKWNDDDFHASFDQLHGEDFEAVVTGEKLEHQSMCH
jgi:hypothetical protein